MDGNEAVVADAGYPEPEEDGGDASGAVREDGVAARNERFDPTPYMRQLRGRGGGGEYLDVKWRLLWLRKEHPDAEIVTEHVQIEPTLAIFKATVTLPSGGKASGYGSETAGDFGDFIEKAETKAIGRALNALGYGAQFGERGDEELAAPPPRFPSRPPAEPPRLGDRGSRPPARTGAERPATPPAVAERGRPEVAPAEVALVQPVRDQPEPSAGVVAEADRPSPIDLAANRDRLVTPPRTDEAARPRPRAVGAAANAVADLDLADYSWTAFWPWARGLGLNGPQAVEGLIGRATAGLSPAQLRELILQARGEG